MKSIRGMFAVAIAVAVLAIAGCAPEPVVEPHEVPSPSATSVPSAPAPEPSTPPGVKPAIADVVLSPDGLGPLELGQQMSIAESEFDMAYFDANCNSGHVDEGSEPGTWLANYPRGSNGFRPFVPVPLDGVLGIIAVHSTEIMTAEGIHLGSSRSEVMAAYPNGFSAQVANGTFSTVYVVDGKRGRLLIEVRSNDASYWGEAPTNVVNALTVLIMPQEPFAISGGDFYYWGECYAP